MAVNKHLFPVYDQPAIYHPLALLMRGGIRDIMLVAGAMDIPGYRRLLGDGSDLGIRLEYVEQPAPAGIADAILHCESGVGKERFCVALGDNLFLGSSLDVSFQEAMAADEAVVFACRSHTPQEFGVVELSGDGRPLALQEKPARPRSDWVVPGLYLYPPDAFDEIRELRPSARGELEVSSLNQRYLSRGRLRAVRLEDVDWLDIGTPERLAEAVARVRQMEASGTEKPAAPEAVAWSRGWVSAAVLARRLAAFRGSAYGAWLSRVCGVMPAKTD